MSKSICPPERKTKRNVKKIAQLLPLALLATCLSLGSISCRQVQVKVLSPETSVTRLLIGTNYTPVVDGYFVPDATMLRILDQLGEKSVFGTK